MSTIYEQINQFCIGLIPASTGTYNGDMIAAAKSATGLTRDMTANEAELLLLQELTGNTTSVLADMRGYWPDILGGAAAESFILLEDGSYILQEDGTSLILTE